MDRQTELLFAMSGRTTRWEDEEKSSNDLDVLREEFRRLFLAKGERVSSQSPSLAAEQNRTGVAEQGRSESLGVDLRKLETV